MFVVQCFALVSSGRDMLYWLKVKQAVAHEQVSEWINLKFIDLGSADTLTPKNTRQTDNYRAHNIMKRISITITTTITITTGNGAG